MDNIPVNDRDSGRNRKKEDHPPKLTYQIVIVALSMLVVMTAYEWLKQTIHPNISIWGSHLITILFTAFLATTVSFFVFKKLNRAYQKLLNESTERRLADQRLRESEEKHRTLFDSSRDAIMTLAPPTWLFTSGNPATVKLFKARDEAEFISFGPWQLSPERQPDGKPSDEKAQEMIEIAMRNGSHFFEWTHCHSDGTPFPAEVLLTRMEQRGQVLLQATVRNITDRKRADEEQDKLVAELQKALSEVKTLRGFLPICSYCKKIRDDKGYWSQIESYIHKHSDAEFSHGICPECAKKYFPDMDLYGDEQTKE